MVVYLLHIPYAGWKYHHLKNHPELWRTAGRRPAAPLQPPGQAADAPASPGRRPAARRVAAASAAPARHGSAGPRRQPFEPRPAARVDLRIVGPDE